MTDKAENPRAVAGSNSGVAGEGLRQFMERIERLTEEKASIAGDIKDVFAEAKGQGYDTKAMREVLKIRAQDPDARQEHLAFVRLYADALGLTAFD